MPYPVERALWKVEYSNTDAVGLVVKVYPTKGAQLKPTVFSMSVVPVRVGDDIRWLVSSWAPKAGSPSAIVGPASGGVAAQDVERISPTASVLWLLVPVVLICLVFVIPVVFLVRERRITRRMRRRLDSRSL